MVLLKFEPRQLLRSEKSPSGKQTGGGNTKTGDTRGGGLKRKTEPKTGESSLRTTKSVRLKVESLKIGDFHLPAARLNKQESNLLALKRHLLKRSKTCALSFAQFAVRDEQIVRNADFISAGKTILIKLVHRKLSLQRK